MNMKTRLVGWALAVVTLSGCAFGQKFNYAESSINVGSVGTTRSASVAVLDQREYVKSGKKSESFIGLSRGGFGNPFDVVTKSGAPMATEMATSVAASLRAKGLKVQTVTVPPAGGLERARQALSRTGSDRLLVFTLNEWKTDTMMRTGLDFDVTLDVMDGSGVNLARSHVSGKEVSGSSILSAEKDAQGWFADKVSELLRDEAVAGALR
jgi:hypothetical protein